MSCKCFLGPIPLSMRIFGELIVPADTITSLVAIATVKRPLYKYSTPQERLVLGSMSTLYLYHLPYYKKHPNSLHFFNVQLPSDMSLSSYT